MTPEPTRASWSTREQTRSADGGRDQADAFVSIGEVLARLYTPDLTALVAAAIDILDGRAGDCDLEDGDPAGDPLDLHGEPCSDDGRAILDAKPLYGADQTLGPINARDANQHHQAAEAGLIRTARGTWRHAA